MPEDTLDSLRAEIADLRDQRDAMAAVVIKASKRFEACLPFDDDEMGPVGTVVGILAARDRRMKALGAAEALTWAADNPHMPLVDFVRVSTLRAMANAKWAEAKR